MDTEKSTEQGRLDIKDQIIETWQTKKESMPQELKKAGGLTAALLRILATSEQVREILLDGRDDFPNRAKHNTLVAKIRNAIGLPKDGGIQDLLMVLGSNEDEIAKWKKAIITHNAFTSGKNDSVYVPMPRLYNEREKGSKFFS